MLFGTSVFFRISYFFTAFSPPIVLVIILNYNKHYKNLVLILFLFVILILSIYIRQKISRISKDKNHSQTFLINFDFDNDNSIDGYQIIDATKKPEVNGDFIKFAISILFPSFTSIYSSKLTLSFIIIILLFTLLMLSNETFPNIILPIFGVQLLNTEDGFHIFYISKNQQVLTGIKYLNYLGNSGPMSRTFVLTDDEYEKNRS
ncbi:hypothetical protein M3M38_06300 [Fructilactobacillus cliffordii]|uniref:hypothetical protein n=1 Tax=Fructilactobacillus cliffordii TaxID=2940299 RepID=UPI002091EA46|nr:hypothetical protein [Fructilactobacillus cliffordii]USS86295.1 hypothetical protein M3M38_06300 [Fructilactobacillus cliffordii]